MLRVVPGRYSYLRCFDSFDGFDGFFSLSHQLACCDDAHVDRNYTFSISSGSGAGAAMATATRAEIANKTRRILDKGN